MRTHDSGGRGWLGAVVPSSEGEHQRRSVSNMKNEVVEGFVFSSVLFVVSFVGCFWYFGYGPYFSILFGLAVFGLTWALDTVLEARL